MECTRIQYLNKVFQHSFKIGSVMILNVELGMILVSPPFVLPFQESPKAKS